MKKFCIFIVLALVLNIFAGIVFAKGDLSPDFGPYMRNLQARIKSNWHPKKGSESTRTVILFEIDRDGNLIDAEISKSSGDKDYDEAALMALTLTAPFQPLPSEYEGDSVIVDFTFDYNVFKSLEEKRAADASNPNLNDDRDFSTPIVDNKGYKGRHSRLIDSITKNLQSLGLNYDTARSMALGLFIIIFVGIFLVNYFSKDNEITRYQNYYIVEEESEQQDNE